MIKNKLKELLKELKNFKVQTQFQTITEEINQDIITKIKKYPSEDCIVQDVIIKHSIKIFECQYKKKKMGITSSFYAD